MNDITPFKPARPAMIVGRAFDGGPAPLGLSEPFALNGGNRLGPDGIALELMHHHQPAFVRWVTSSCQALIAAERPWFRGVPILVTGPRGAGRTHAARRLAHVVGVPHVFLNLTDPVIAANIASSGQVSEALWTLPTTVAMAAKRCANPIVSVIGIDKVGDDVAAGLIAMIDPATGRAWSEDRLQTHMDFGEVTWIIQCDGLTGVPPNLRALAAHVAFSEFPANIETTAALSILLEVLDDLGFDEADPLFDWPNIARGLGGFRYPSAKQLYAGMADAVTELARSGAPKFDHNDDDDDVPF
ncbi:ATP-binding protein [Sphingomonas sp. TF3]|uniref:ATP-binding protein n=1 Tax=Sphingomonas sp. TF3 TaxID=2495580 RepID=UPI000F88299A|nr:ATP-binding protein [Sphingomonas sp. TF3]RUN78428.1 ATP-binding protein [Sphingomonas sp. TF3]